MPFWGADGFVQGWLPYLDNYPGSDDHRIVIQVRFGNLPITFAIFDTGTPWCILHPQIADDLDFDYKSNYEEKRQLLIRGVVYNGWLCRIPVTLQAQEGNGFQLETTTFVPDISDGVSWNNPNFIGLRFIESIRFAIDPTNNRFYFGSTDE